MEISKKDRYLGCLIGLAVGDALGAPIEWKKKFRPVAGMRINKRQIGSRFGVTNKPGHHTDDTSMALCLAESLIKKKGFDPKDQLERYVMWMEKGHMSSNGKCEGMGKTTRNALTVFQVMGHTTTKVHDPLVAGNGSIMRLAPVPMAFAWGSESMVSYWSQMSSQTTHVHPECINACIVLGTMISRALNGCTKDEILDVGFLSYLASDPGLTIKEVIEDETYRKAPPYIEGSGHVVKSLEAALWAFANSSSYKEGVLMAVNLGKDSDTTAAIFGQLAGAYYGYSAIPKIWKDTLIKRNLIERHARQLLKFANGKAKQAKNPKNVIKLPRPIKSKC